MKRATPFIIIALLLSWIGLRLHYATFWFSSDMPTYVQLALLFARGNLDLFSQASTMRMGVFIPAGVFIKLFGNTSFSLMLWPLICSFLTLSGIFILTKKTLGIAPALFASFLYVFYPADINFSTILMPDLLLNTWQTLALLSFIWAYWSEEQKVKRNSLMVSAFFLMLAYFTREDAILVFPVFALGSLYLFQNKFSVKSILRALGFLLGALLIFLSIEGLIYYFSTGDFFHRLNEINRLYGDLHGIPVSERTGLSKDPHLLVKALFSFQSWFLTLKGISISWDKSLHGILYILTLIATLVIALDRISPKLFNPQSNKLRKLTLFMLFALYWQVFYREWGTQSLFHYVPIHRLERHFIVFSMPAIWICSLAFKLLKEKLNTFLGAILIVLTLGFYIQTSASGIRAFQYFYTSRIGRAKSIENLISVLKKNIHPPKDPLYQRYKGRIVGDWSAYTPINYFINGVNTENVFIQSLNLTPNCETLNDTLVYYQLSPDWGQNPEFHQKILKKLPCLQNPPKNWIKIETHGEEKVYYIPYQG